MTCFFVAFLEREAPKYGNPLVGGLDWFGDLKPWFLLRANGKPPDHQTGLQISTWEAVGEAALAVWAACEGRDQWAAVKRVLFQWCMA